MTHAASAGARVIGSLRAADGRGTVRIEDHFGTDIDDLWSAVTRPERLARWVAHVEGDLHLGGTFRARFTSSWEGQGRVEVCEPPHRLMVAMDGGDDDRSVIEVVLAPDGQGTRLVIEQRGLPLETYAGHGSGWQAHVEDLAAHLAGRPTADWRVRWAELTPLYRDLAGDPVWQAERASLMTFLAAQRRSVLAVVEGLDQDALQRSVVPSGWTPLGVVEHLGHAERFWFQAVLTGAAVDPPWPDDEGEDDGANPLVTKHSGAEVFGFYHRQCAIADEVLSRTALLSAPRGRVPGRLAVGPDIATARDVILHMIEETARHAGHLDIARELIDGRVGLGAR